jgi:lipopolysaccharide export system protein LptA
MRKRTITFLLISALSAPLSRISAADVGSDTPEAKKSSGASAFEFNKKDPIYITADWMEVDQNKNTITYKGRVVTIQADMTMRSETLTAYYDPNMKQMKQIVAEGKVNATQGSRVATGDKAIFDDKSKTVTLTGNPVMRQGNSQVSGTKVIYYMDQDRAVAESDGKVRVQATIFPEDLQNQDKNSSDKGKSRVDAAANDK